MWRTFANPSVRTRRLATSSFFIATFAASILTVSLSASTLLPCPANSRSPTRATLSEPHDDHNSHPVHIQHNLAPTSKHRWIQIEQPLRKPLPHPHSAPAPPDS